MTHPQEAVDAVEAALGDPCYSVAGIAKQATALLDQIAPMLVAAAHRQGYALARAEAAKLGAHIRAYDVVMKG